MLMAEIFKQLVINEYKCRKVKEKRDESKDEALTAALTKKSGKQDKWNVECFNCHKKGHYKSECWAKGGGNEGNGPKQGKGTKEDAAPAEEKTELEAWAAIEDVQEPIDEPQPNDAAAAAGSIPVRTEQASPCTMTELYDSGASRHMSPFHDGFVLYKEIALHAIMAADKRVFYMIGTRDLEIEVPHGKSSTTVILKDVLHAPKMGTTIVSVNRIMKAGYVVTFKDNTCQIQNQSDKIIGIIPVSQNGLYKVEQVYAAATPDKCVDLAMLHCCLAHIAPDAIQKMVKTGAIEGIKLVDDRLTLICDVCEQAKAMHK